MADANFLSGRHGLIAIDKVGNQVLFLDPDSYETVLTLEGFAPRVHELLTAPDRTRGAQRVAQPAGLRTARPHPLRHRLSLCLDRGVQDLHTSSRRGRGPAAC